MDHVRPSELRDWFAAVAPNGATPVVLDVREPWEWQTSSVKAEGFELVCIPMGSIPSRLADIDPARPVACLCHHGARSLRVAVFLQQQGFGTVANITGGIEAWAQELDPALPRY
ncbi:rhodanese-like domain-containing protein [Acidovorax lacteus]|uniref:Rhodanese-like domain-containing protein n=1 Tax=Acidovorax lacteus TaxID=1924988 RepID=A0ABP8L3Z2_9BURK